jgi:hypothetical protein
MMAWALLPGNPYGYYVLLRLVSCLLLIVLFFFHIAMIKDKRPVEYPTDLIGWLGVFVLLALIYNPIIQIHLTREIWSFLNIATIIVLGTFWYLQVRVFTGTLVFTKKSAPSSPPAPKLTDDEDCQALTREAIKCFEAKRYGDCAWVLDKIIGKYDKNNDPQIAGMVAHAYYFKAESLIFLNRKEEGIKLYFNLIEQFAKNKDSAVIDLVKSAREKISKIQSNN